MSDRLDEVCRERLTVARGFYLGEIYRPLGLRSRRYEGLHLIWDAPTRIVIIAYCWEPEDLKRTREDVLHFHTSLPQLHIYKKLHLILFHADKLNAADQPWPSGVSFSPIAAKPDIEPPPSIVEKLDSILGIPAGAVAESEVAAAGKAPDWRLFLRNDRDIVRQKVKELAGLKADLPQDMREMIDQLLELAEEDAPDLQDQVREVLDRLWEVPAGAATRSNP